MSCSPMRPAQRAGAGRHPAVGASSSAPRRALGYSYYYSWKLVGRHRKVTLTRAWP